MDSSIEKSNGAAAVEPLTSRGWLTAETLKAQAEQRKLLAQYIEQQMVEDTDYGKIPGTDKPTLLKPGAEKLVDLFRCTPKFALIERTEDFDRGLFAYTFRVRLYQRDVQAVVAEGFGSANSKEGRYRWRNAKHKCPKCGKETLNRSKQAEEFYCWQKIGGCGATFALTDQSVTSQPLGKVENDDIATLANTVLKMAKKRALVDGAIALARCSDLFAQDLEDLAESGHVSESAAKPQTSAKPQPPPGSNPSPKVQAAQAKVEETVQNTEAVRIRARLNRLWDHAKALTTKEGFADWRKKHIGTVPNNQLTAEQLTLLESHFSELEPPKS